MKALLSAGVVLVLASSELQADGPSLAGTLWRCNRTTDQSQFVITFYPGGGVGGGELQEGGSPYVFDATHVKKGEWPGRWDQKGRRFTWRFPDQHMEIAGTIRSSKLIGTEVASGSESAITCAVLTKLPRIGEGLVIPKDSRFIDLDGEEGMLKVPVGISLQKPRGR